MKALLCAAAGLFFALTSCGQNSKPAATASPAGANNSRVLVTYFSATGTTRQAATDLAEDMGASLVEIKPATPYTDADLDWRDSSSRSSVEMHDRSSRPAIADTIADIADYDVIFIGYPNWWNTAPTIINTFIESHNLEGKTVIPFMTSGGSGIENSEHDMQTAYPSINWKKGRLLNSYTRQSLDEWRSQLGL